MEKRFSISQRVDDLEVLDPDIIDSTYDQDCILRSLINKRYSQDTRQRKSLAVWVSCLCSVFIAFVIVYMILLGAKVLIVEPSVSCSFLGATAVEIIGLAAIVLHGLFDSNRKSDQR